MTVQRRCGVGEKVERGGEDKDNINLGRNLSHYPG